MHVLLAFRKAADGSLHRVPLARPPRLRYPSLQCTSSYAPNSSNSGILVSAVQIFVLCVLH
jgi:hypothetical protein